MNIPSKTIEKFDAPWGESFENVRVDFKKYGHDGTTAIQMWADDGELLAVPSVNLAEYGIVPPTPLHVFIKDYSEGEGMTDLLVHHGIVTRTETVAEFGPFQTQAILVRINA